MPIVLAIHLDPQSAIAYGRLGEHQRAIEDYSEAIRLDPQLASAYGNRALAYTAFGKHKEAQQDAERAVELGIDRRTLDLVLEALKKQR